MTEPALPLHDATLVRVALDWVSGRVTLVVRPVGASGERELVAEGVASLECSRKFPWGRTVSINGATVTQEGELQRFELELQSGDAIAIVCASLAGP